MKTLLQRTRRHKAPIAAVGAAGGGGFAVAGLGFALAVAAGAAGIYFLERARRKRGEIAR